MRRGLRWLGRNSLHVLAEAGCGFTAAMVLDGRRMPWWAQLAWVGVAALLIVRLGLERATVRMQAEQLRWRDRPISCDTAGCPVRLNGTKAGRFERLAHDLWMWSPGS